MASAWIPSSFEREANCCCQWWFLIALYSLYLECYQDTSIQIDKIIADEKGKRLVRKPWGCVFCMGNLDLRWGYCIWTAYWKELVHPKSKKYIRLGSCAQTRHCTFQQLVEVVHTQQMHFVQCGEKWGHSILTWIAKDIAQCSWPWLPLKKYLWKEASSELWS